MRTGTEQAGAGGTHPTYVHGLVVVKRFGHLATWPRGLGARSRNARHKGNRKG